MNGPMLFDALAEACILSNGSPLARPDKSGPACHIPGTGWLSLNST
jgi:hypothetical protein